MSLYNLKIKLEIDGWVESLTVKLYDGEIIIDQDSINICDLLIRHEEYYHDKNW